MLFILALTFVQVLAFTLFTGCSNDGELEVYDNLKESKMQKVDVDDIEIAFKKYGSGSPLLMIMGYAGTMDMWDPELLNMLATSYQVIVFDNRGMGMSSAGDKEFTMEQFADDTAGLLDALSIETSNILGWSMGAGIAQELALRHPEKVEGLILYAADPGGSEGVPPTPKVMASLKDSTGNPSERGERLLNLLFPGGWLSNEENLKNVEKIFSGVMEQVSPESVERQYAAMESWPGTFSRLHSIQSNTMLVTGTNDILTPPENSVNMVGQIPGAWLVQFEGCGHGLQYQEPLRLARSILYFLE